MKTELLPYLESAINCSMANKGKRKKERECGCVCVRVRERERPKNMWIRVSVLTIERRKEEASEFEVSQRVYQSYTELCAEEENWGCV